MQITRTRALRGPNLWTRSTAIEAIVQCASNEHDIQQLPGDFAVTELWEVLAGRRPGRTGDAQVTVFDSVGFALEDFSALRFLRDAAERLGVGQPIALIPQPADPKDLFGMLRAASPLLAVA